MRKLIMFAFKNNFPHPGHTWIFSFMSPTSEYIELLKHHTFTFFIYFVNIYLFGCVGFQLRHVRSLKLWLAGSFFKLWHATS